ncbi:peptidoglycan/LPS O-acetylase OafA/YrhL [Lachnospiraceae bacterium PF1-21]|uniref:acyltransferase family protein n=1 Tax=Ohessyouella blattaphilus TaxID=2949333 RepID=UPI003E236C18
MIIQNKQTEIRTTNNFGLIRLAAAFMVMSGHMGILLESSVPTFFNQSIHSWGIKFFFLIGGYLITKSWMRDPSFSRFTIKRVVRIFPPLIFFVLFITFIGGPLLSTHSLGEYFSSPQTYRYLLTSFLNIQYFLPGVFFNNYYPHAINGSLWSLPVEFCMYFIIALCFFLFRRNPKKTSYKKRVIILFLAFYILRAFQMFFFPNWHKVLYSTDIAAAIVVVPYYAIGAVFTIPEIKKTLNLPASIFFLFLFKCFFENTFFSEMILIPLVAYFIFSLAFSHSLFIPVFFAKADISYGIYLYGFFIQQLFISLSISLGISLSSNTFLILSVLITTALAWLSMKYIEKPTIALGQKLLNQPFFLKQKKDTLHF